MEIIKLSTKLDTMIHQRESLAERISLLPLTSLRESKETQLRNMDRNILEALDEMESYFNGSSHIESNSEFDGNGSMVAKMIGFK